MSQSVGQPFEGATTVFLGLNCDFSTGGPTNSRFGSTNPCPTSER